MLGKSIWRRDTLKEDGQIKVVWAWRLPESKSPYNEGMLVLYSLAATESFTPEIHALGMTHEFQVYEIDPDTPIDFRRNLFEQKKVSPLLPACVAYQFKAINDESAVLRMDELVKRVYGLMLPPNIMSAWAPYFHDGIEIGSMVLSPDNIEFRQSIEDSDMGEQHLALDRFRGLYRFERTPSVEKRLGVGAVLVLLGVLCGVAFIAAIVGPSLDDAYYLARSEFGTVGYSEMETPNGIYVSTFVAVPGHPHRFRLLSREKIREGLAIDGSGELISGAYMLAIDPDMDHDGIIDLFPKQADEPGVA